MQGLFDGRAMMDEIEKQLYSDAWHIAWVGASNQSGVQFTLNKWREYYNVLHPAMRAIAEHLNYLRGHGLGPDLEDLEAVKEHGEPDYMKNRKKE